MDGAIFPHFLLWRGSIMARQPFRWHALAIAAGLGTVGVGVDIAGAQTLRPGGADGDGLIYERQLDLSLNPTKAAEAAPSVADTQHEAFVERSLHALVPEYDGTGRARSRVVHGTQSTPANGRPP
jgi:hypothetical protein